MTRMQLNWMTIALLLCFASVSAAYPTLAINEFMAHNQHTIRDEMGDYDDWIEIYNFGKEAVDIAGMYLTDDSNNPLMWQIPDGDPQITTIPPEGYLLIWADGESHEGLLHAGFALSTEAEQIGLYDDQGGIIDSVSYEAQGMDKAFGRFPDGVDSWGPLGRATPGSTNRTTPATVIFTEIMYHPAHPENEPEPTASEFIELYNAGAEPVDLTEWHFTDGVDFTFPTVSLAPSAYVVVAAHVDTFRATYPAVDNVIGNWSGRLGNAGERLELVDNDGVIIDWIEYADEGDWAVRELGPSDHGHRGWVWSDAHDGKGRSLELINLAMPNADGQNWTASRTDGGSPGQANSVAAENIPPLISDVRHFPVVPDPNEHITVTAQIADEASHGISIKLYYRRDDSAASDWAEKGLEAASDFSTSRMFDDGSHDDGDAQDGTYGGQIPNFPDGAIVEFFVAAEDAEGAIRTWPAPSIVDGVERQLTNALVLVDGSFDWEWLPGRQPVYHLVMLQREQAELAFIGSNDADGDSDAQMNGTFICVDGTGISARHQVGIRNRGAGSRTNANGSYRNNYRLNFPHDDAWSQITSLNIKNRYSYLQVLGTAVWHSADLPAPRMTAVQLRINGSDFALQDDKMYGSYVAVEVTDSDFARRQYPEDPSGNIYQGTNDRADLGYEGTNADRYRTYYQKKTNEAADDYSDLIHLTDVLNNAPDDQYLEEVSKVINLSQWLRFLAVDALTGNLEGGLTSPKGDDYVLYAGVKDPRFWLIPHDLDTLFGEGDHSRDVDRDIHVYAGLDGFEELFSHPAILAMYHRQLLDLIDTEFSPGQFEPLVDQVLAHWVPETMLTDIKEFMRERAAAVLTQLPRELTVTTDLPILNGYYYTPIGVASFFGTAHSADTRSIVVADELAELSLMEGRWTSGRGWAAAEAIVSQGASWKYLDDGSNQGTAWRQRDFPDETWSVGVAQLGYGDGDEDTVIDYGSDGQEKHITAYFRHAFDILDPSAYLSLQLRLLRDDGAVVYLNGSEIARSNMPDGPVDYLTRASSTAGGDEEDVFIDFPVDTSLLVSGRNVITAEVHQSSSTSSDVSFDLTLDGMRPVETEDSLTPGINRITVKAFAGPDGTGKELDRSHIDVWYDTGYVNDYPRDYQSAEPMTDETFVEPVLIVRDGYLPGLPVLVRLELRDRSGAIRRDIWNATATLSIDNSDVQLQPNQIHLYNGLGSAMVTFNGTGEVLLTADVGDAQATALLMDVSDEPVQEVSGVLMNSAVWSGIYHIVGGDFLIADGVTLTLEPGALVLLDGVPSGSDGTDLRIEGSIQSLGTPGAPVTFTAAVPGENWGEMRFINAESSLFQHTNISQAGHSPRIGHSNSGPTIRAEGSDVVFYRCSLTDNAGKLMHVTSGCDLTFEGALLARSIMGPEIASTGLLLKDSWIAEMHANDDADGIYIHSQQAGQRCLLSGSVIVDVYDDGLDTLGSEVTVEDTIIRNCRDKGVSVYGGETTIDHCLLVENNMAPEDPTVATIAAKTFEGGRATVNIHRTTIVTSKTLGHTDIGIQSHNKYGVADGTITYNVSDSIIDATDPVDVEAPYRESDIHITYCNVVGEDWPGEGNTNAQPLFVAPANHDYRLQEASLSLEAGTNGGVQGYYQSGMGLRTAMLSGETVWMAEQGPYRITGELIVPADASLTIFPGTSVYFEPNARLVIHGVLVAEGTEKARIRFTRSPGSDGTWNGLQFIDTAMDNRITYAVMEYGRTDDGMVGLVDSQLVLDHCVFDHTDLRRIRTIDSSLKVSYCTFTDMFDADQPPTTDNRSEHIWGHGVPTDGWFVIENNSFGVLKGHNDAIDFDGPVRPNAIPQILNNRFSGGGDDALDLETDAHIEGNIFSNFVKDQYNTSPREGNAISAGAGKDYVVVRNVFHHVDHAAQIKDRAFMTFVNNTVVDARHAALYFSLPGQTTPPGEGVYVDSCIFEGVDLALAGFHVEDPQWGTTSIRINRSLIEEPWHFLGEGNMEAPPRFIDETSDFRLQPGSPAIGAGANGLDIGALVPAGASVVSSQGDISWRRSATFSVGGPGITHYRYSLNNPDGPWSGERTVDNPIQLTGLQDGLSYQVYVLGKNSAGVWQQFPTASDWWVVDTDYTRLIINEVLAANESYEYQGNVPDMIELYYDGPHPLDVSGMSLTNEDYRPTKFVLPQGTTMQPGEYLTLFADNERTTPGLHVGFTLDDQGGLISLYDKQQVLIDTVSYGQQLTDLSIGRVRPKDDWALTIPTFGWPNLRMPTGDPRTVRINEWLAQGEVSFRQDFIELFNPQIWPVDVGGLLLTDAPATQPDKCRLSPHTFIPGESCTALVADKQELPGHVNFALSENGELVSLRKTEDQETDQIIYGPQMIDVSQGRTPNGAETLAFFGVPTPGLPNPVNYTEMSVEQLVSIDSIWSYDQNGDPLSPLWYEPQYNDSSWPTGAGLLYAENSGLPGPKNTALTLGPLTFYFRTRFVLDANKETITGLDMRTVIDDGAIFYLNGQEVLRLGMPDGDVNDGTRADRTVGNAEYEGPFSLPIDALEPGENVLAVEVHQTNSTSSDIVLGIELGASLVNAYDNGWLDEALGLMDNLRVTELMYHAPEGDRLDFVELTNVGTTLLTLDGVRFSSGIEFVFPAMQLAPGEYVVVVDDVTSFVSHYGTDIRIAGEYTGRLSNRGEDIVLMLPAPYQAAILRFEYEDAWYPTADGGGQSLIFDDSMLSPISWNDSRSWHASPPTPGHP